MNPVIFGSTYLEDYWELGVHIETADASGLVPPQNHAFSKFLNGLKHNLRGAFSAENVKFSRMISTS